MRLNIRSSKHRIQQLHRSAFARVRWGWQPAVTVAAGLICTLALAACRSASGVPARLSGESLSAADTGFRLAVLADSKFDSACFSLNLEAEPELVVARLRVSGAEALN
jgi:hypothetical protein